MVKIFGGNHMDDKLPFETIEREKITKRKSTTDDLYGNAPEKRSVEQLIQYGIINVNKPSGPS